MADNSIKIKTEIQTKQAEVQLATLENRMTKTAAKAEQLRQAMSKMEGKRIETKEYEEITKYVARASEKMEELIRKREQMASAGKEGTPAFENMSMKIEELRDSLMYANDELKQLRANGEAFTLGENTDTYQRMGEQLRGLEAEMDIQNQKHGILEKKMQQSAKTSNKLASALGKAKNALKAFGNLMGKGFKSTGDTLKSSLTTLLKYSIGIQALSALFRKLRSVAAEAFGEMAKQVPEVNNNISSMKTALNGLKASVGTMLQPLLSAVSGLITQIINKVAQLATAIGGLFARLTGQSYVYKATAAQVDYAKSLDNTGKSAKKTKQQLAGFDELNVINSQDDSNEGGGGGGASPMATFKKEDIPENIKNIADWLKEMWDKADFTELGALLGTKLKEALENIPWDKIQETGRKIGKSVATLLNGFFEVPDLGATIGRSIGEALNTVVYTIQSFFQNLHGISIGQFFGDLISEGFTTIDWSAVGNTVSLAVSTLMDLLIGFLQNLKVEEIGGAIADFLKGIDWFRLLTELGLLLWEVVIGAVNLVLGLLAGLGDLFAEGFRALGLDGIAGFFEGLSEKLRTLASKIREWFGKYVLEPVKSFLGIHSPSTVFAELGKYCIEGMMNGIKSLISSVVNLFVNAWNAIKAKTISIWASIRSSVLDIFASMWQGIKGVINSILGGIEAMANGIVNGINKVIGVLNNLSIDIPDWIPEIGGKSVGFHIPTMSNVSIPRLAQGAVIPPNREFLAVLGDQNNGTNIEAPIATIEEALRNVLASQNINVTFQVEGDPNGMFKVIRKEANNFSRRTGNPAFA